MRFYEISSGVRVPISQEEQEILDLVLKKRQIARSAFDERQQEVARLMVSRGLLLRDRNEKQTIYRPNDAVDIWRF